MIRGKKSMQLPYVFNIHFIFVLNCFQYCQFTAWMKQWRRTYKTSRSHFSFNENSKQWEKKKHTTHTYTHDSNTKFMYNLLGSFWIFNKHPVKIALNETAFDANLHANRETRAPAETKANIKSNYVNCKCWIACYDSERPNEHKKKHRGIIKILFYVYARGALHLMHNTTNAHQTHSKQSLEFWSGILLYRRDDFSDAPYVLLFRSASFEPALSLPNAIRSTAFSLVFCRLQQILFNFRCSFIFRSCFVIVRHYVFKEWRKKNPCMVVRVLTPV